MRGWDEAGKTLVKAGVTAGVAVSIMYPARTFLPLPEPLTRWFFMLFGPGVAIAYVGIFPFLVRARLTAAAILGTVFGVLAGLANAMFAAVQLNNLDLILKYRSQAENPAMREQWLNILNGVLTVQNGMNFVADLFFDWTAFAYAIVFWNHPKFGKPFSALAVLAGGTHFVLKMLAFPQAPSEAGYFDAGPAVSIFFALVTLQVLRHIRWMSQAPA